MNYRKPHRPLLMVIVLLLSVAVSQAAIPPRSDPSPSNKTALTLPADDYTKKLDKAQSWKVLIGKTVVIYYVEQNNGKVINDAEGIRQKLDAIESVLEQDRTILGVTPLSFLVPIYLFPSSEAQGKAFGEKAYAGAATQFHTVTCVDGDVNHLKYYLSHELTHILVRHQIADPIPDFLQEGIACWVQTQIANNDGEQSGTSLKYRFGRTTDRPLKDVYGMGSEDLEAKNLYIHAASFVEYLLSTGKDSVGGMATLRAYYKAVSQAKGKPDKRLQAVSRTVLGKDLETVEREWRSEAPDWTYRNNQKPDHFRNLDFSQKAMHWRLYGGEQHVVPGKEGKPEKYRYPQMSKGGFTLQPLPEERAVVLKLAHPAGDARMTFGEFTQTIKLNNYAGKRYRVSIVAKPETHCFAALFFATDEPKPAQHSVYSQVLFTNPGEKPGYRTYWMNVLIPPGAKAGTVGVRMEIGQYQGRADSDGILRIREIKIEEVGSDAPVTTPHVSKLP